MTNLQKEIYQELMQQGMPKAGCEYIAHQFKKRKSGTYYDETSNQAKLSLKVLRKGRSRRHRKQIVDSPTLPIMKLGFQSIANNMDEWIKEAKERNDEV